VLHLLIAAFHGIGTRAGDIGDHLHIK